MPPPGPSKQFDRDQALQTGMTLFWRRGYADVSMSDLLAEMQIGRQSFYNTFGSKNALFDEAVTRYVDTCQQPLLAQLEKGPTHDAAVVAFLTTWEKSAARKPNDGCFLVNSCDDLPCLAESSVALVTKAIRHFEKCVTRTLQHAIDAGEISSDFTAKKLARILVSLGNGIMLAARDPASRASPTGLLTDTYRALTQRD